ncbi:MAG: HhH-GPD family protein [Parcubacteria group bacterium GW2011_GWA2_49_9]|nr:MAG: HhH-GPD family protein [Parcubacteria group bacterium GW2011_GWA2_49_9]
MTFQQTILNFYREHRRDFPWRETRDPYAILVSEIMLQQTQAERVVPFFNRWMKRFPTPESLASAKVSEVLKLWQGLGYNRRVLNLKRSAEMIVKEYGGVFPKTIETIDALPGVGPYTAGAVCAFAFGIPSAFIETNIRTVYLHFFFKGKKKVKDEEILKVVERTLPTPSSILPLAPTTLPRGLGTPPRAGGEGERRREHSNILKNVGVSTRDWYNALMDYGAMLKKTTGNLNTRSTHYTKQSVFIGSRRQVRGAILRLATEKGTVKADDFKQYASVHSVADIISELAGEGFLKKKGNGFKLA